MASQPFDVPRYFLDDLRVYDPLLRVVWDRKDEYWRIERKVRRPWAPDPHIVGAYASPQDWECRRDGYVIVLRVPVDCLDNQVFMALGMTDIQRRGGYKRVSREMDDYDDAALARSRHNALDEADQRVKARWTSWNTNYPTSKSWHKGRGDRLSRML